MIKHPAECKRESCNVKSFKPNNDDYVDDVNVTKDQDLVPKAASRRIDNSTADDGIDDDSIKTTAGTISSKDFRDFREEIELKDDHENRPL
ncbi:unnamed protein product [Didymodactylos carnosus]|uniref:Uncharacterized protein n=1 Tax=Didymodactylos carnosus TaxID=1234261 RepID=A0A814AL15_9BILA|nr:unnamed protein product [Didymodactylos carnosus]CAF0914064.1 unnamed protein product [Didymodactylos carnosus]CAF3587055.1 unnamed protein product [Didymodactylos carnosus]CAF3694586.1 unnamed protein product [Didymodactylos carnosus]